MKISSIFTFALIITLQACSSSEKPKPDPGRCFVHSDCMQGQECIDTRCQDLYFPRHKIKTN